VKPRGALAEQSLPLVRGLLEKLQEEAGRLVALALHGGLTLRHGARRLLQGDLMGSRPIGSGGHGFGLHPAGKVGEPRPAVGAPLEMPEHGQMAAFQR
jgi:hypothetical protein